MKRLFLSLVLSLSSAAAASPYLQQSTHIRSLMFEDWSGSYIESTFVGDLGTVRFDFCQRNGGQFRKCERLHRPLVLIRNLAFYESHLLAELKELRLELAAELDSHFVSRLLGGSQGDRSIVALDLMMEEIRRDSLANWLLLTVKPQKVPAVATITISTRVAEAFRRVFELPVPAPVPAEPPAVMTASEQILN